MYGRSKLRILVTRKCTKRFRPQIYKPEPAQHDDRQRQRVDSGNAVSDVARELNAMGTIVENFSEPRPPKDDGLTWA